MSRNVMKYHQRYETVFVASSRQKQSAKNKKRRGALLFIFSRAVFRAAPQLTERLEEAAVFTSRKQRLWPRKETSPYWRAPKAGSSERNEGVILGILRHF